MALSPSNTLNNKRYRISKTLGKGGCGHALHRGTRPDAGGGTSGDDQVLLKATRLNQTQRYANGNEMLRAMQAATLNNATHAVQRTTATPHFCRFCGAQAASGARFCIRCGMQIAA